MDGHASVVIMSKLCAFAEVLWHDAETTQITRGADDYADNYNCSVSALQRLKSRSILSGSSVTLH
jgi:hypothetical protein